MMIQEEFVMIRPLLWRSFWKCGPWAEGLALVALRLILLLRSGNLTSLMFPLLKPTLVIKCLRCSCINSEKETSV